VVESLQGTAAITTDLATLLTGSGSQQKDILLLRDYLLSADMLRTLDEKLNLREHYSSSYDVFSRLWSKDVSAESFLRHYLRRIEADYDEYSGLLVIRAQAYTPAMAHAIGSALVQEASAQARARTGGICRARSSSDKRKVPGRPSAAARIPE
jgi:capsular polysaccharide transport system permease protein